MPALGREFRTHPQSSLSHYTSIVTVFQTILGLWLTLFSVDYTMNMVWLRRLLEFLRTTTRVTQPQGGFVIWVELPRQVDSLKLCQQALVRRISIAPGQIFFASQKYRNFIRLNCAQPWSDTLERTMITLGRMTHALANPG